MRKLLLILAVFTLAACETLKPLGAATQEAVDLNYYWMEGAVINSIDTAELSTGEMETIIKGLRTAESVRSRLLAYYDSPQLVLEDIHKVDFEYSRLRRAYLDVRDIIVTHKAEYSPEAWELFTAFDKHANALDRNYEELSKNLEINAAALSTVSIASSLLKVLAVL